MHGDDIWVIYLSIVTVTEMIVWHVPVFQSGIPGLGWKETGEIALRCSESDTKKNLHKSLRTKSASSDQMSQHMTEQRTDELGGNKIETHERKQIILNPTWNWKFVYVWRC